MTQFRDATSIPDFNSLVPDVLTDSTAVSTSLSRAEQENDMMKRASSRGVIPRAKIKSIKMTLVIVFGEETVPGVRSHQTDN